MRQRTSNPVRNAVPYPLPAEERRKLAADSLPELDRVIQTAEGRGAPSRIPVPSKLRENLRRLFAEPGRALLPAMTASQRVLGTIDAVELDDLRAIRGALSALTS